MHNGVGLIITNKAKNRFFVQQKDENYPKKKWANCYSFWGGKIEDDDSSTLVALKRELAEEILDFDFETHQPVFVDRFEISCDTSFIFNLYELQLEEQEFELLKKSKINEGSAAILSKEELKSVKWIWCLEQVVEKY